MWGTGYKLIEEVALFIHEIWNISQPCLCDKMVVSNNLLLLFIVSNGIWQICSWTYILWSNIKKQYLEILKIPFFVKSCLWDIKKSLHVCHVPCVPVSCNLSPFLPCLLYVMLVRTVFMLKPLEARNAAEGTNTHTDGHRNL